MKNNPLIPVCIFFCLGIWTAKLTPHLYAGGGGIHIPLFLGYACFFLFLVFALVGLNKKVLFSLSLAAAICCAGALHLGNAQIYSLNHIINFISDNPQKVYIKGKVATNPEVSQTFYHSKKTTFSFKTCDLRVEEKWQAVEGLVKVALYGEREVQHGDELLLQGLLARPPGLRNPGGFNYREYLANHRIFGLLRVKEKDTFKVMSLDPSVASLLPRNDRLFRELFKIRQRLHRIIFRHLGPPQAALLSAILLGERSSLSQDIKDLFINTGTIHILATQCREKSNFLPSCNLTL